MVPVFLILPFFNRAEHFFHIALIVGEPVVIDFAFSTYTDGDALQVNFFLVILRRLGDCFKAAENFFQKLMYLYSVCFCMHGFARADVYGGQFFQVERACRSR